MITLKTIIEQERETHTIENMARQFGFKNVKFFFEKWQSPSPLNLLVDVDEKTQGNALYAGSLGAKLTELLKINVAVLVSSKIIDAFHIKVVEKGSISIYADLSEIQKLVGESIETHVIQEPTEEDYPSARELKGAENILKKRKLTLFQPEASTTTSTTTSNSETSKVEPSKVTKQEIEEFFEPSNQPLAKEVLQEHLEVLRDFNKRRKEKQLVNSTAQYMQSVELKHSS